MMPFFINPVDIRDFRGSVLQCDSGVQVFKNKTRFLGPRMQSNEFHPTALSATISFRGGSGRGEAVELGDLPSLLLLVLQASHKLA